MSTFFYPTPTSSNLSFLFIPHTLESPLPFLPFILQSITKTHNFLYIHSHTITNWISMFLIFYSISWNKAFPGLRIHKHACKHTHTHTQLPHCMWLSTMQVVVRGVKWRRDRLITQGPRDTLVCHFVCLCVWLYVTKRMSVSVSKPFIPPTDKSEMRWISCLFPPPCKCWVNYPGSVFLHTPALDHDVKVIWC